jgi:hypothetical protein
VDINVPDQLDVGYVGTAKECVERRTSQSYEDGVIYPQSLDCLEMRDAHRPVREGELLASCREKIQQITLFCRGTLLNRFDGVPMGAGCSNVGQRSERRLRMFTGKEQTHFEDIIVMRRHKPFFKCRANLAIHRVLPEIVGQIQDEGKRLHTPVRRAQSGLDPPRLGLIQRTTVHVFLVHLPMVSGKQ